MKRKSLLLTLLTLVTLICFSFAFAVTATASATTVVSKFEMHGASVRLTEGTTGLRFECLVDYATYNAVTSENSGKSFGAFIVPKDVLDDNEITGFSSENTHVAQFKTKEIYYKSAGNIGGEQVGEEANSDYVLYFSFVSIQYGNYTRDFYSLFYIQTGTGESATYEYATIVDGNNVRNVGDVAKQYIFDEDLDATAINFAVRAQYIKINGFDPDNPNETAADAAVTSVTAERLTAINDNIDALPATDAEVSMANQTAITATYNAYDALSAAGKALYSSADGTKINARYTEFNNNYTVLFDLAGHAFANYSAEYSSMTDGLIRWNANYTNYNNVKSYAAGKNDDFGNYREFDAQLGSQNLIFVYKDSELAEKIGSNEYVYMYVYNSDTSSQTFTANFGSSSIGTTYFTLPAASWSLIEIPAADFISGNSFGILYYGGNHTPKFGNIFTCSAPYAARMDQYNSNNLGVSVKTAIDALGAVPAYNTVDKDTVIPATLGTVNTNYNALSSPVALSVVDNKAKLDGWNVVNAIKEVIKEIDAMETYSDSISVAHNASIYSAAQTAYDALDTDLKAYVSNSAKLTAWMKKAAKVKLLYATRDEFRSNITSMADTPVVQNAEQVETTPPSGFGELHALRGVGSTNYYIQLNTVPDLTGYDVVRFPIWLNIASDTYYYLVYKFNGGSLAAGYTRLYKGLNIVTVPVSYLFDGFCIGGNDVPAQTWLYYAIPYAEKLATGDNILADYDLECNNVFVSGASNASVSGSYQATVTAVTDTDATYGTVAGYSATKNPDSGAGENYSAYFTEISALKAIVSATGATGIKFKVLWNGSGSRWVELNGYTNLNDDGTTWIEAANAWKEITLSAEAVALWNGYLRKDWARGTQILFTDFTIVK